MNDEHIPHVVRHLNALNRAVVLARKRFHRSPVTSPDDFALNVTLTSVITARDDYRVMLARACAPWFDRSAFRTPDDDFAQPHHGHDRE